MRILMLVWTGVATDARVLREARALVEAGHTVHIIGRAVPDDFDPGPGITVGSAGLAPAAQGRGRRLSAPERAARWALLPQHRARRLRAWQEQALRLARTWAGDAGVPDVVHVHDFTALEPGVELAREWSVPYVYDTHEYWVGRPVEGRPAPVALRREARVEDELVAGAAAVVTVGDGVARALRRDHPTWPEITVVRNTFPLSDAAGVASPPAGLVYAGRLARDRELEVVAAASRRLDLPVTLMGPADAEWLEGFDPGAATVEPSAGHDVVDQRLREAGAALVTHSDRWENHRLAMPNKLFHAVAVGVPVVATDVGELGALVREHGVGTLYPPGSVDGLVAAVERLRADHPAFLDAVRGARAELSWDRDAAALVRVHRSLGELRRPLH
ncbi:glycosyltransferase involved in cell wall biosynthesis [Knoellia remsis]|uniref:Glycosyltransferase involved in cell wall biosynthesis n=1 Tax=Knoellia remsis TaxID=407159 RepID=A0A2T0UD61_9MICO|nr:glycosyltransferase [Knoellia remsis]PRY55876.1 glycosyltransferase involved in cell wall biosynthesis [Knoellia remsis]